MEVSDEDVEKATAEEAERSGRELEEFKKSLNDRQKEYLKDDAAISLVLDLLMKDAVITEKKPEEPKEEAAEEKPAEEKKKPARKPRKKKEEKEAEAETSTEA